MEQSSSKHQIRSYIIQSQEEEIKRISLELHEGVGQNLYSIYTGLQFVESGLNQPHLKNYLHEMTQLIEKTIQEIRLLSVELHPPALTTLGLLPAIKSYIKLYTSTFGVLVDLEASGEEKPIPEQSSVAVFRVCQEALTNIAKHADTSNVKLSLIWKENELKISIVDFGGGFELDELEMNPVSLGVAAMMERMLLTGGHCVISSKIGEGTSVEISLPL
ncbi:two-component system sensor histidine kinase NreB [Neobacillus niacini]|uniref:sensor histidine kinase n=1 Tax=Neobacillus niacini TaxID=86668 RepID=UPI00285E9B63|nr:ATP-binding protein [Neobacillus niacini]MDR7077101.1 two-component system sensor histidine kinase NreB [Neobacillus niacini]